MDEKFDTHLLPPTLVALDELATELDTSLADLISEITRIEGAESLEEKAQSLLLVYYRNHTSGLSEDCSDWQDPASPLLRNALDAVRKMNRKI